MGKLQDLFSGKSKNSGVEDKIPDGFIEVFGPHPRSKDFRDAPNPSIAYRSAVVTWNDAKKNFKRAGIPPEFSQAEYDNIVKTFEGWGTGPVKFYEGRYGWMARFPESPAGDAFREVSIQASRNPHNVIAGMQMAMLDRGKPVKKVHPFVPPDRVKRD